MDSRYRHSGMTITPPLIILDSETLRREFGYTRDFDVRASGYALACNRFPSRGKSKMRF
jgi:hypothetical protein